jgi:PleD family two-component response regulator
VSAEDLITLIDEEPATYPVETGLPALTSNQSAFSLPVPIAGRSAGDITRDPLIMIVDDEPINAKVAQQHLKMQGYRRFIVLTDSREAVAMVAAKQPDIVLLDIMMPWVSGLEILEQLRSDDRFVDLPIISSPSPSIIPS